MKSFATEDIFEIFNELSLPRCLSNAKDEKKLDLEDRLKDAENQNGPKNVN